MRENCPVCRADDLDRSGLICVCNECGAVVAEVI